MSDEEKLDDSKIVKALLDNGAKVDEQDESGETALMWASERGNLDIDAVLLDKNASIDKESPTRSTALMFASRFGRLGIVVLLVERGADIHHKNVAGDTELMNASRIGKKSGLLSFYLEKVLIFKRKIP